MNKTIILLIFVSAFLLRIYGIGQYDLWFDEVGTNLFTETKISKMSELSHVAPQTIFKNRIANDPHSSLYYWVIYHASKIIGEGYALRYLSVLFSLLAMGMFYRLARLFFNSSVSIYALMIMAFNPFHVWYAQEARVYALASFLTISMLYFYFDALKNKKMISWIMYVLTAILSILASYYTVFLIGVSSLAILKKENRGQFKTFILSLMGMGLVIPFMLSTFTSQLGFVSEDFWLPQPSLLNYLFTWLIFNLGYSGNIMLYSVALVIFSCLFVWGVYILFKENRFDGMMWTLLCILPIVIVFIISLVYIPLYINRQFIIFSPIYYLIVAKGIGGITQKQDRTFALVCVLALLGSGLYNYYHNYMLDHPRRPLYFTGVVEKKNYMEQLDYINQHIQPGDIIAVSDTQSYVMLFSYLLKDNISMDMNFNQFRLFAYPMYLQKFEQRFLQATVLISQIPEFEINNMATFIPLPNGTMAREEHPVHEQDIKRMWMLSTSWHNQGEYTKIFGFNTQFVRSQFNEIMELKDTIIKDGVYLDLFQHKEVPSIQ